MQQPRYDSVSVALYDPVALNRNATRNVLYSLGFREIESYAALDDLRRAMATRDFDLVALEGASGEDPVYDFVRRVRRQVRAGQQDRERRCRRRAGPGRSGSSPPPNGHRGCAG